MLTIIECFLESLAAERHTIFIEADKFNCPKGSGWLLKSWTRPMMASNKITINYSALDLLFIYVY